MVRSWTVSAVILALCAAVSADDVVEEAAFETESAKARQALAVVKPKFVLPETPLTKAVGIVAATWNLTVEVDWDVIFNAGFDSEYGVSANLTQASAGSVLEHFLLNPHFRAVEPWKRPVLAVVDGKVTIRLGAELAKIRKTVAFDVASVAPGGTPDEAERLFVEFIRSADPAGSKQPNNTISLKGGKLIVSHHLVGLEAVRDHLRALRESSVRLPDDEIERRKANAKTRELLARPMPAAPAADRKLREAMKLIVQACPVEWSIDWEKLDGSVNEGVRREIPGKTVRHALMEILAEVSGDRDLPEHAAFVIENGVVVVSTRRVLNERRKLAAYDVSKLAKTPAEVESLKKRLTALTADLGDAEIFAWPGRFLILADREVHDRLEAGFEIAGSAAR